MDDEGTELWRNFSESLFKEDVSFNLHTGRNSGLFAPAVFSSLAADHEEIFDGSFRVFLPGFEEVGLYNSETVGGQDFSDGGRFPVRRFSGVDFRRLP